MLGPGSLLCSSVPLTNTNAAIAKMRGHNEMSSLVHTHALQASVHASDEPSHTCHTCHCGTPVIAGEGGNDCQER